jgi:glycosyltransferase involved in cell wall biosynthesis
VICAAYNGREFIAETIKSLKSQQESRFEVVIVDDASTDQTPVLLSQINDSRFRTTRNEANRRLVYTRNKAIELSLAPYVAVTDQDDISLPQRLKIQSEILERFPRVSAVYSFVKAIDQNGAPTQGLPDWNYSGQSAKAGLIFHNFVSHSSLMFRRSCAPSPVYASDYPLCEDYNLLVHLADQGDGLHLVKQRLVEYRYHDSNHSKSTGVEMSSLSRRLRTLLLKRLNLNPSESEMRLHDAYESSVNEPSLKLLRELREWSFHLRHANQVSGYVSQEAFNYVLSNEWLTLNHKFTQFGKDAWREFIRGPIAFSNRNLPEIGKLWLKTRR